MIKTFLPLLLLFALPRIEPTESREQTIFERIEWVCGIKPLVEKHWPGFSDRRFDVPLIYYTDSVCYAANPTEKFLTSRPVFLKVFENRDIKIYKTPLSDTIPFHMSVSMSVGDPDPAPGADWDYRSPFMLCSSFEITQATVPGVESVEEWATMIMHEYFHGFQFRHPEFLKRFEEIVNYLPPRDTLKNLYKHHDWFAESIDSENDALLTATNLTDRNEIAAQVEIFFQLRTARREKTREEFGFDPAPLEQFYETAEGTARYVEWALQGELGLNDSTADIPEWLTRTDKTTWFYASGFNLARLLDTLGIEYKARLFNEGTLSLEAILQTQI